MRCFIYFLLVLQRQQGAWGYVSAVWNSLHICYKQSRSVYFLSVWVGFLFSLSVKQARIKATQFVWVLFIAVCPVISWKIKPYQRYMWAHFTSDRKDSQKRMSCHKLTWKRSQIWIIKYLPPPKALIFHTHASKPHVQAFSSHSACQYQGRCDNFVICATWFSCALALLLN